MLKLFQRLSSVSFFSYSSFRLVLIQIIDEAYKRKGQEGERDRKAGGIRADWDDLCAYIHMCTYGSPIVSLLHLSTVQTGLKYMSKFMFTRCKRKRVILLD